MVKRWDKGVITLTKIYSARARKCQRQARCGINRGKCKNNVHVGQVSDTFHWDNHRGLELINTEYRTAKQSLIMKHEGLSSPKEPGRKKGKLKWRSLLPFRAPPPERPGELARRLVSTACPLYREIESQTIKLSLWYQESGRNSVIATVWYSRSYLQSNPKSFCPPIWILSLTERFRRERGDHKPEARVDCNLHPNILPNVGNERKVLELINHIETGRGESWYLEMIK